MTMQKSFLDDGPSLTKYESFFCHHPPIFASYISSTAQKDKINSFGSGLQKPITQKSELLPIFPFLVMEEPFKDNLEDY